MSWNGGLFDRSFWKEEKENVLNQFQKNQPIKRTIVPMFEILFNDDTGFGIYEVEDIDENRFSIKGTFVAPLVVGQTYAVDGYIAEYRGEKQIGVNSIHNVKPVNKKGIVSYLQTLKGLKSKAELIYDVFGDKSIDVLMKEPMEVARQINGIGKKSVMNWAEQLDKMKDSQVVMSALLGYGLTPHQANQLFKKFGDEIVQKIEQNPYVLSLQVRGYGFERCDRIARNMGYDPKSSFRIQEALVHVLTQASTEGHCFLPLDELISRTVMLLTIRLSAGEMKQMLSEHFGVNTILYRIGELEYNIQYNDLREAYDNYEMERNLRKKEALRFAVVKFKGDEIGEQMKEISLQRRIVFDDGNIYIREHYQDEQQVSKRAIALANATSPFKKPMNIEIELKKYLLSKGYTLEKKQHEAVVTFSANKGGFYLLLGNAGCGKTFTLKIILAMIEKQFELNGEKCRIKVFAPTGKASKVASKSTERECMTIHRGLGFNPVEGFMFNEDEPLECDVLIVDESSMMDISIAKSLLNAIANGTKVIFMGDTKQLPSVGAGNVLKDLIASGVVQIVMLDVVKRQGAMSGIIRNANRIINGEMIESCEDTKDAFVINRKTVEGAIKGILDSMKRILTFPDFTMEDIQVLAPQRTGPIGTYVLNYLIQQEFNSHNNGGKRILNQKFEATINEKKGRETILLYFQKGDKVIHINNEYDMPWYIKGDFNDYLKDPSTIGITNGECGVIEDIIEVKEKNDTFTRIIVKYEDKYVFYDDSFKNLDHSWALTIHKSQGSQWKAVIMPMMKQYYNMLDNNLFYTGYTRAELFSCVVGQPEAIYHAIKTHKSIVRYTALDEKIKEAC
jgi:exodeoxyribonuclease V alpha subunit